MKVKRANSPDVNRARCVAVVHRAMFWHMYMVMGEDMFWCVAEILSRPICRAVEQAVRQDVSHAVHRVVRHPLLEDFTKQIQQTRSRA